MKKKAAQRSDSGPTTAEFILCVIGIYVCFLTWGLLQERVSTTTYGPNKDQKFKYFVTLNTIQAFIAAVVAYAYLRLRGRDLGIDLGNLARDKKLLLDYAKVALLNCMASPFGYMSLRHIDYPTMILGKSCKLVPVMIMNIVLYGRTFPKYKYVTVAVITAGVAGFTLMAPTSADGGKKKSGENSLYGLVLLMINLLIDGATNSIQDRIFQTPRISEPSSTATASGQSARNDDSVSPKPSSPPAKISGTQMMFFMNFFGVFFTAFYLLVDPTGSGELRSAVRFCQTHPSVLTDVILFGICGALGQCFIFHTIERFGSLRLVTITVTRKLFTMLLSVAYFGHDLAFGQWVSVALVFSGIALEAYVKSLASKASVKYLEKKTAKAE